MSWAGWRARCRLAGGRSLGSREAARTDIPAAAEDGPTLDRLCRSAPPPKARPRPWRRASRSQLAELNRQEAAALEAALGVAPEALPLHLRAYALQRRSADSFSGPGLLPVEVEAGRVEYKLRLAEPTHARFQQLVSAAPARRLPPACAERPWPGARWDGVARPAPQAAMGPAGASSLGSPSSLDGSPLLSCAPARHRRCPMQATQLNWRLGEGEGECLYALVGWGEAACSQVWGVG